MPRSRLALSALGIVLFALATVPRRSLSDEPKLVCNGKYKGGLKPTDADLKEILQKHDAWVMQMGPFTPSDKPEVGGDTRRVNLCGADLSDLKLTNRFLDGANLQEADLTDADLSGASLSYANLIDAQLGEANLTKVNFEESNLSGAFLRYADLSGANLAEANLTGAIVYDMDLPGADLTEANLTNADLSGSDLTGVDLFRAKMKNADLSDADLANAYLDFDSEALPKITPDIASAQHLDSVRFDYDPAALVHLRKQFKDLGLRTQAAQLTYAIRRSELERKRDDREPDGELTERFVHGRAERFFNTVFFDWTCQYGMSPTRPLLLVVGFGGFFTLFYIVAQWCPRLGGIWVVWDEKRPDKPFQNQVQSTRLVGFPYDPAARPRLRIKVFFSVVMLATYFSLLSALRIGWSGLNFGTWITRMQLREYSLYATGWTRFASGLQSLISIYLVALAILAYFGNPFE
jgi:hypothetical protein